MLLTPAAVIALTLPLIAGGRVEGVPGSNVKPPVIEGLPLSITEHGMDLIVHFEVGGKSYYEKAYSRPIWPQGASGVTVGIGYDLGYNTASQIKADWSKHCTKAELAALVSCAGIKGSRAKWKRQEIRWKVQITLEEAMAVFLKRTVPRFASTTRRAFPHIEEATPYVQDMMLSQTFNRGSSTKGHSRRHVKAQAEASAKREFSKLPGLVRASEVVWRGKSIYNGLKRRRFAEADHGEGRGKFIP